MITTSRRETLAEITSTLRKNFRHELPVHLPHKARSPKKHAPTYIRVLPLTFPPPGFHSQRPSNLLFGSPPRGPPPRNTPPETRSTPNRWTGLQHQRPTLAFQRKARKGERLAARIVVWCCLFPSYHFKNFPRNGLITGEIGITGEKACCIARQKDGVTSRDHPRQSSLPDSLGKCCAHSLPIGSASVAIVHVKLVIRISLNVSDPSSHQ